MLAGNSARLCIRNTKEFGKRSLRQPAFPLYGKKLLAIESRHHHRKGSRHHGHGNHTHIHQNGGGIQKQSRTIATNKALTYSTQRSFDVIPAGESNNTDSLKNVRIPYPREIVEYLDKHVIGQDSAKKTLAVSVYQHYRRLLYNLELREEVEAAYLSYSNPRGKFKKDDHIVGSSNHSTIKELQNGLAKKKPTAKNVATDLGRKLHKSSSDFLSDIALNPPTLDKSNVVLVGPSGCGKTYLTQKLAAILDVPFALCDCTTLTQSGYVGEDADSVIQKLFQNSDGDIERTQRGIVFLDEFDKIATSCDPIHSSNGMRDVSGRGVQQALLKIVEGTICRVKNPFIQNSKVDIDTTGILFIASGAFNNLDKVVARRLEQRSVGFGSSSSNHDEDLKAKDELIVSKKRDELLAHAEQSDLIGFGMIPEVVGRFPIVCAFHSLDEEAFVKVMAEPQNSLLNQAKRQFAIDGIKLEVTEDALQAIASQAVKRKTGARALRSIFEKVLLQAKFDCPGNNIEVLIIDKATIESEGRHFTIVKKNDFEKDNLV